MFTVAIPTYNRNDLLRKNVPLLVAQLRPDTHLLILDNCCDVPVVETLGPPRPNMTIIRHACNVGGNANILRCFEHCKTPWLWLLADDDEPLPDAVKTVEEDIQRYADALYINYSTGEGYCHPRTVEVTGAEQLLRTSGSFGNLLFISSCVFRADVLRERSAMGHHYAYTSAPHLVMTFLSLGDRGKAVLSERKLVTWYRPEVENRSSVTRIAIGLATLQELPLSNGTRNALVRHLARFPTTGSIAHQLILQVLFAGKSRWQAIATLWQVVRRLPLLRTLPRHLAAAFWTTTLLAPRLSWLWIEPCYRRKTGHATGPHKMQSDKV